MLDGKVLDCADTAVAIIPGAIGIKDVEPCFGGIIDEVRIWKDAISISTIREWKKCSLQNNHPNINSLYAYYPLDDFDGETSVNWVGKGHQAYHIRSGRSDYYGSQDLAKPVIIDNPSFKSYTGKQRLFNSILIHNEWDFDKGEKDRQVVKLRIAVRGSKKPKILKSIDLGLEECTSINDIENIHIYYTGNKADSDEWKELSPKGMKPQINMHVNLEPIELQDGINYILVTCDVKNNAVIGNNIWINVPSYTLDDENIIPDKAEKGFCPQIVCSSKNNKNVFRVLQWNIWHGGSHVGNTGQQRVLKLVKASSADVIMMQEAYGIQKMLSDSLNFFLRTKSMKDNLALYSRYSMEEIPWREPFFSNPVKIKLPCDKTIMFVDCWLRYAYRPEYTSGYANRGLNPNIWVKEDSLLALNDLKKIVEFDINPNMEHGMPVILAGDFNSCSHLDWTDRAKDLHNGYGAVDFPVSKYIVSQGFVDAFRLVHPDEVKWQCGTVSAIWGQMQMSRIDFTYFRGYGMRVLNSKVIRTSPNIDDVWPSDHAATLTTFIVN